MKKLGLLFLCLIQFSCKSQVVEKINGVSFVASRSEALQEHIDPVVAVNANYAAVMPLGYIRSLTSPQVVFDTERQWFGETLDGVKQYIEILKKNKIKVMLKPQIWIWRGEFTGHMKMQSEADWKILEETYSEFILTFAKLAEETNVEIYCIGTELEAFVKERPDFWQNLIKEIKTLYKGKLTYAANWDEYTRTPFWSQLDYIGVDAYFPLSEEKNPSQEQMLQGWQKWKLNLKNLATEKERPILFTEFGYRSMDFNVKKPWLVDRNQMAVNLNAQSNATKVILEEFWKENWFAGGFVWKWFIYHDRSGGPDNNRFTPQNKPAEDVIRNFYSDY